MKLYEGGKANLWEAIKVTMLKIEPAEAKKFQKNQLIIDY